ncbi:MAG: endonuclease MutS2, partial [Bacteroidetes bacterium]|nr:endonuclease MutS2 [Bacteroidota bacterium]
EIIPDVDEKKKELSIIPGQKVRIWKQGTVGEVLKVNPSSILLSIGEMMTTMPREDLEIISEKEYKSSLGYKTTGTASSAFFDLDNRRLNFSPNVDIRGQRADEAVEKVQNMIDEAIMLSEKDLRVLHGKGNGILRQVIRQYLSTVDVVSKFQDEDIRFGGTGITLIHLEF